MKDEIRLNGTISDCSYITLRPLEDGRIYLDVGCCCLHIFQYTIPVELITHLLWRELIDRNKLPQELMKELSSKWERQDIAEQLIDLIEEGDKTPYIEPTETELLTEDFINEGFSISEIATRAGVSKSTIYRIINGMPVSKKTTNKIGRFYKDFFE